MGKKRKRRTSQSGQSGSHHTEKKRSRKIHDCQEVSQRRPRKRPSEIIEKPKTRWQNTIARGIFNFIFYFFTISIIVGAALFTMSKDSDKSFFGYRFYTVLTNSMLSKDPSKQKGGFAAGDIIIVQMINPKELQMGDIITFNLLTAQKDKDAVLTHRIIEKMDTLEDKEGLFFTTQGDANTAADHPIKADQVIGKKVFVIPYVGRGLTFMRDNLFISLGALFAFFALIVSLKYYFSLSKSSDPLAK